jgi:hypothetical protein
MAQSIKRRVVQLASFSIAFEIDRVTMFSFSRSKLTQSTLSLTSRRSSSEEFDDCCSQMDSPPAPSPSPSCYNYQERVLALFIQQQRMDCTSSSSSSSSTSPSPDDATPLGVCHFVSCFVPLIYLRPPNICQKKKAV